MSEPEPARGGSRAPGPWALSLRPDIRLAAWVAGAGVLFAGSAAAGLAQTPALAAGAGGLLLALTMRAVRADALRSGAGVATRLELRADGTVQAWCRDGRTWSGRLEPGTGTWGSWVLLRTSGRGILRRRTLLLTPGACDAEALRRLRVGLRWGMRLRSAPSGGHGTSGPVRRSCKDGHDRPFAAAPGAVARREDS